MERCSICGKSGVKKKVVRNYVYPTPMGLVTIEGNTGLEECIGCGEVLVPGKLIDSWNKLILSRLTQKQSRMTSLELQFIFSVLPYSQNELAQATGKDRSTLTRYKNGENPIDPLFEDVLQQIISDYLRGQETTFKRLKDRSQFVLKEEKIRKLKA